MNIAEIMERDIEEARRDTNWDANAEKIAARERRTAKEDRWVIALVVAVIIGAAALAWYVYRAGLTQDDLFDEAARKAAKKAAKKKPDAEVVEVQPLALPEPKCVHFDETKNGCSHKDADCAECANCDGWRRECTNFSLTPPEPKKPTAKKSAKPKKTAKGKKPGNKKGGK